jgi:hypothetical protein
MSSDQYGLVDTVLKTIIALGAIVGAFLAWRTKKAVQEVHVSLNSRLTQLLDMTAAASRAEGRASVQQGNGGTGPAGPAGIQGPIGPQGQVGPQGEPSP